MRVHVPILLALSANSPYWRGDDTGLASARMPIFRAFPRVGIPPYYDGWDDYERRIGFMVDTGVMEDYTWLWYDVRPHPNFGTVEIRAMDAQTHVEHTLGAGGADPGDGQGARRALRRGQAARATTRTRCSTRTSGWRRGTGSRASWSTCRSATTVTAKALARRLYDRLKDHAQDLGAADALEGVLDLLEHGNGAYRQRKVYEANRDFSELLQDIVAASAP